MRLLEGGKDCGTVVSMSFVVWSVVLLFPKVAFQRWACVVFNGWPELTSRVLVFFVLLVSRLLAEAWWRGIILYRNDMVAV